MHTPIFFSTLILLSSVFHFVCCNNDNCCCKWGQGRQVTPGLTWCGVTVAWAAAVLGTRDGGETKGNNSLDKYQSTYGFGVMKTCSYRSRVSYIIIQHKHFTATKSGTKT